jgi:hypothetical protein
MKQHTKPGKLRVHVVGISPRSGTSLLHSLLLYSFDFDCVSKHEARFYELPRKRWNKLLSKYPYDLKHLLKNFPKKKDGNNFFLIMKRDPRDVVISKQTEVEDKFFISIPEFLKNLVELEPLVSAKNSMLISYEDLLADPNAVQREISRAIPQLIKLRNFEDWGHSQNHLAADNKVKALNGIRPIESNNSNNWMNLESYPEYFGSKSFYNSVKNLGYASDYEEWESFLASKSITSHEPSIENNRTFADLKVSFYWYLTRFGLYLKRDHLFECVESHQN